MANKRFDIFIEEIVKALEVHKYFLEEGSSFHMRDSVVTSMLETQYVDDNFLRCWGRPF